MKITFTLHMKYIHMKMHTYENDLYTAVAPGIFRRGGLTLPMMGLTKKVFREL